MAVKRKVSKKAPARRVSKKASVRKTSKARKVSVKRNSVRKSKVNKSWIDVPHEKSFFVNDGSMIKNFSDLPKALQKMDLSTFQHHVNELKHDFANWVDHVHGEAKLAKTLRSITSKSAVIRAIKSKL